MKRLKKNYNFLSLLSKSSPKQRKSLLRNANKSQILSLSEICLNILAGNIPVNIKKLRKYKRCIRKIACRKTSFKRKKNFLVKQRGGFLPLILPAVLSGIAGLVGKAIGKRL